jgi:hypothetical protein
MSRDDPGCSNVRMTDMDEDEGHQQNILYRITESTDEKSITYSVSMYRCPDVKVEL